MVREVAAVASVAAVVGAEAVHGIAMAAATVTTTMAVASVVSPGSRVMEATALAMAGASPVDRAAAVAAVETRLDTTLSLRQAMAGEGSR